MKLTMKHIRLMVLMVFLSLHAHVDAEANAKLSKNHIEKNVPPIMMFDLYLERDLFEYFRTKIPEINIDVAYKYLRIGPTQSGVSYPKYYLWIDVSVDGELVESGAMRVAAVDRSYFRITNFVPISTIRMEPKSITAVFPGVIADKIYSLAGENL